LLLAILRVADMLDCRQRRPSLSPPPEDRRLHRSRSR
jgi:hypothetical protein